MTRWRILCCNLGMSQILYLERQWQLAADTILETCMHCIPQKLWWQALPICPKIPNPQSLVIHFEPLSDISP
jgi:hypothetical protein